MEKFIVSARKYRPLTFESVVGQQHITSTLRNAILRGQVAHAYLFCGPRGVGKTTCARILSKSINCLNPQSNGEACGECESCVAFAQSRSFNIHELDAASNNSVDNIRSLTEQVRIPPQIGKYSIYIIDEAHMLSTAAFNAFLKTLEEPPAHAIFILATTEKHKILPTILSRCQTYDFKRIKVEDMVHFLQYIASQEGIVSDDESLHIIAQKADGCMRDALSMFDKVVSFCGQNLQFKEVAEALNVLDYDSYFTFTEAFSSGDYKSCLLLFDSIMQKGFEATTFLSGLSGHLRNLLVAADSSTLPLLEVTGSIAKRFSQMGNSLAPSLIFDSLNIIASAEGAAKSSLNLRLLTEITILKLCNLSPLKLSGGSNTTSYTLPRVKEVNGNIPEASATHTAPTNEIKNVRASSAQQPSVQQPVQHQPIKQQPTQQQPTQQQPIEQRVEQRVEQNAPQPIEKKEPPKAKLSKSKGSMLGVSISSMLQQEPKKEVKEESVKEEVISGAIAPEDVSKVLDGCKEYTQSLRLKRPRWAEAFDGCKVVDGEVVITVANDILKEELTTERHTIISGLVPYCKVKSLRLTIVVDESLQPKKRVLLKDEDKRKFLIEENGAVLSLCKKLDLDYQ